MTQQEVINALKDGPLNRKKLVELFGTKLHALNRMCRMEHVLKFYKGKEIWFMLNPKIFTEPAFKRAFKWIHLDNQRNEK